MLRKKRSHRIALGNTVLAEVSMHGWIFLGILILAIPFWADWHRRKWYFAGRRAVREGDGPSYAVVHPLLERIWVKL